MAPCDARALRDLCAGVTWMQRVPPALLASYRALYVILRGDAADAEDEINRDIMRTVRGTTGLLLDLTSDDSRNVFAGSINRVLNALAHVDDMGYCQGQNYVVDVMMKAGLPERETFCLFLYLLRQGHFHGMYRKEVAMLAGYMDKLEEQLKVRLPDLSAHFEAEHYPPPLYALEWITTFFGLAAQPLVALVALDLFLAGARNPVLRLCVSLLGEMEEGLRGLDQEGLLKDFRSRAVNVDAEAVIVRALTDGGRGRGGTGGPAATAAGGAEAGTEGKGAAADRALGWSTGPDYLLILRSRHCQTLGLVELREEAQNGLLVEHSMLQDALLAVTRSLGWGSLRTCWLESCLAARSDHERYTLASESLRFVIANGGHVKAACFMLGVGGADANGVDSRLLSPLHLVALFNRPDIARVLLMCGASPRLVGGVTRVAAARGGKLWSPLEMAEEACTEGGPLDEAGVAVGPATAFVLRGLVCLQCNVKLPRAAACGTCKRTFCKLCQGDHFCVGKLNLPRGVAEACGAGASDDTKPAGGGGLLGVESRSSDGAGRGSRSGGRGGGGGRDGSRPQSLTRWELGSAIGDDWEGLFSEGNANAQCGVARGRRADEETGEGDAWKPGGLRRFDTGASTRPPTEDDLYSSVASATASLSSAPWATMASVMLGTWERRPQTANPKDRDTLFDNSAAFVRACFPAQTWLQYHMEEEMGLPLGRARSREGWGGPFRGLGINGEYYNPEIMRSACSTELHRHMSWVMAESGVPWEENDDTWCCPECFILYSINVFRHHCRGCGQVYCSAHAPPTEVPHDDRPLKLCWSCVLEGAIPLPDSLLEDEQDEANQRTVISLSPNTARGIAEDETVSPTVAVVNLAASAAAAEAGGAYVAPQPPSPLDRVGAGGGRDGGDGKRHQRGGTKKKEGSGFLSALVSLIEVVASPTSPVRSRGGGGGGGGATAGADKEPETKRPPALSAAAPMDEESLGGAGGAEGGGGDEDWRAGWSTPRDSVGVVRGETARIGGDSSPLLLRKEYDSESASRTQMLHAEDVGSGFPSPSTAGFLTESGDDLARYGSGTGVVESGVGVFLDEKPVELGFPSERPWAHGFGT
eukprot:g14702.t1